MENHDLADITSSAGVAAMPYLNSLWDNTSAAEQFTNYFAVDHPSFPNYAAMATGETIDNSDTNFTAGQFTNTTVWSQLSAAGDSWGVFDGSEPYACDPVPYYNDTTGTDTGAYKIGHNNAVPFADVYDNATLCDDNQPLSDMNPSALPDVSFVAANLCDDMHGVTAAEASEYGYTDCVSGTSAIETRGDNWLAANVPLWTEAGADVLITFDEGDGSDQHIYAVLTGRGVTDGNNNDYYTHYSILAGIEDAYGLPLLGNAAGANPIIIPSATSTTSPAVVISSPANNATVSGSLAVSGTASDSAGVTGVQVSVDGGTPVPATGTTAWSTSIDTADLSNGPHTITATATDSNGNTGSATISVTVSNGATACPTPPAGDSELSGNISVETSQSGWTGTYNARSEVTRVVPAEGSYDGSWALQVGPTSGASGTAGVNNANPRWVTDTTARQSYTASVFVSPSVAGEQVSLTLRETTSAGTGVGYHTTTLTLGSAGQWQQITLTYSAQNSGDSLHYSVYSSNFANSSQDFLADCLSLWTPS